MLFFQCYPAFQRFDCKVFLTEALRYFSGAAKRVMIDNTQPAARPLRSSLPHGRLVNSVWLRFCSSGIGGIKYRIPFPDAFPFHRREEMNRSECFEQLLADLKHPMQHSLRANRPYAPMTSRRTSPPATRSAAAFYLQQLRYAWHKH